MKVYELFDRDIRRPINAVVKIEDDRPLELETELDEYVVTAQIGKDLARLLSAFIGEGPRSQAAATALWISGFFGAGKSHFLKILCMLLRNERVGGMLVVERIAHATQDEDLCFQLRALSQGPKTVVVQGHMKQRAARGEQIVEVLWKLVNEAFGYSRIAWVGMVEQNLRSNGLYEAFVKRVEKDNSKTWRELRNDALLSLPLVVRHLHGVDPSTYGTLEIASDAVKELKTGIAKIFTSADFTQHCLDLLKESGKDRLFFGLDEMGQFIGEDTERMLELTAIVECFATKGAGRLWMAVTAQEALDAVFVNYASIREKIAKIQDRFPRSLRVELTTQNAETVVRERLLGKNSAHSAELRSVLAPHETWLLAETGIKPSKGAYRPSAVDDLVASYPFLPQQFQVTIDFMQALAADSGVTVDKTAKGARALIDVCQQICGSLADETLGSVVDLSRIYDAMEGAVPTSDSDVMREFLERHNAAPLESGRVLRASFVFETIKDRASATRSNIERALIDALPTSASLALARGRVSEALDYLVKNQFVREEGVGDDRVFRFLRQMQRNLEAEARTIAVSSSERNACAVRLLEDAGSRLGLQKSATYHGVRKFSIEIALDDPSFIAGDRDVLVRVYSPLRRSAPDDEARRSSLTDHGVYWLPAAILGFEDTVEYLVQCSRVHQIRAQRSSTDEEKLELRRFHDALANRQDQECRRLVEALRSGEVYVEGSVIEPGADPMSRVIEAVVAKHYPKLAKFQVVVSDRDIQETGRTPLSSSGPAVELGLIANGEIDERCEFAQTIVGIVRSLQSTSTGATGDRIAKEAKGRPNGFGELQTQMALALLVRRGALAVSGPGGQRHSFNADLVKRIASTNSFKQLVFAREDAVDPIDLKAAIDRLENLFDIHSVVEPPQVSRQIRDALRAMQTDLRGVLAAAMGRVPQVQTTLDSLADALTKILGAESDAEIIKRFAGEYGAVLEKWRAPFQAIQEKLVAADAQCIHEAGTLGRDCLARGFHLEEAKLLVDLVEAPEPWKDVRLIKVAKAKLGKKVQDRVAELERERVDVSAGLRTQIERQAALDFTSPERLEAALILLKGNAVPTCVVSETSPESIALVQCDIEALPSRRDRALISLMSESHVSSSVSISLRDSLCLPRLLNSENELEEMLGELRAALVKAVCEASVLVKP
jgi:hypothetical protein